MLDLHAHILPALDTGPASFEEALLTVAALRREGVTEIVATPHYATPYTLIAAPEVQRRVAALQRVVAKLGIPVRLYAGHEAPLESATEELLARGTIATINDGPYVLLTLPPDGALSALTEVIRGMRRRGFIPLIANIEQYVPAGRESEALVPLIEEGAFLQVSAPGLVGMAGAAARDMAEELLLRNMAHVLASGAHAVRERPSYVTAALRAARALVGPQRLRELVVEVPRAIIEGAPVEAPPILAIPRTRRRPTLG